jgi:hypothetical protein
MSSVFDQLAGVPLAVVPSGEVRELELLETTLEQLAGYARTAPQWRLDRWSFAATSSGRLLVRGLPLPPLPGVRLGEWDGVCLPAGCAWSPAVEPLVVRQLLRLLPGEMAILRTDGSWDRVSADDWVRASRSAIASTRESLAR